MTKTPLAWTLLQLLTAIAVLLPARAQGQLDPDKALASLAPADGLEVSLFAAEPQLVNPTCLDVDPQGRVWVCEGVNYRAKAKPPFRTTGDRIVRLEDTDGDGRCDRSTVFYEGTDIEAPLGIYFAGDRIFVSQSPDIFTLDIRPDGSAGEKRSFLTGFGGRNHDHGVHSVFLGPDGLLYGAFGNEGAHVTDRGGGKIATDGKPYFGGCVFRCNVDGTGLKILAHNFRNNYECALDAFGNIWQSDNDDDGNQWGRFTYVMTGGNYGFLGPTGRHWSQEKKSHFHMEDPGVVPTLLRTGAGSPTGLCVYEGDLLPEKYRGVPIHTDAGPRVVQCFRAKPLGAGWAIEGAPLDANGRQTVETLSKIVKPEALLESSDSFFRPSDVAVAPDGSLFVADWYDPGVGGHGMGDTSRGRIYRLTPRGHKGYRIPPLDLASPAGVVTALTSPCVATRGLATQKAIELGAKLLEPLQRIAGSASPTMRARALWLLARLNEGRPSVVAALSDLDPRFRVLAVRCLKLVAPEQIVQATKPLLEDPDPQVRREILLVLQDVGGPEALASIVELASQYDGQDRWYLEALAIASRGRESEVFRELAAGWKRGWTPAANGITWVLHPKEAASVILERLDDSATSDDDRASLVSAAASLEGDAGAIALGRLAAGKAHAAIRRQAAEAIEANLGSKWESLRNTDALVGAARSLLATAGLEDAGASVAAAGRMRALREDLEAVAARAEAPEKARVAALRALGAIHDDSSIPLLQGLASGPYSAVSQEAVNALGRMSGARGQSVLRELLESAAAAEMRSAAVKALGASKSGAVLLLHLAQSGELPEAVKALATTVVHSSGFEDVRLMAAKILPQPKASGKEIPPAAQLLKMKGDAGRGRNVFFDEQKGNCGRCHRIRDHGSAVGPELTAIGTKLGKEGLLEAVLSPSAAIAHEYKVWILETRSAGFVTGYIAEETPQKVTLKDANGQALSFEPSEVLSKNPSDVSLMPEGLVGTMTVEDLVNLLEFLSEQKPVAGASGRPAVIRDWLMAGPFPNPDDRGLDVAYGPETRAEISSVYDGRDGKVAWRSAKAGRRGYLDFLHEVGAASAQSVVYTFAALESPADQDAALLLGSDDGVKVWVNGALVHTNHVHRAAEPEQDRVRVRLRKGRNDLLIKVDNGDGATGLYCAVEAAHAVGQRALPAPAKP